MKITSESTASDQLRLSLRKYIPWTIVAVTTVVHLLIAARSVGPMYVFDEVGYLANANVIAGAGADWALCGSSYAVGYSAALGPLWFLPVNPVTVYQIAALVGAALGALAIWPATALAKRFGANGVAALGIGALVTLVPSRALMDNYVLAENPLTLLVLSTAILAVRLAENGRRLDAALVGFAAGLAAAVDVRALPLVAVTLAWVVVRAIVGRMSWLDAALAAIPAIAIAALGLWAQAALGAQVFAAESPVAELTGDLSLLGVGEVLLGQAFAQVVSWSLLTALGLLACVSKARADARSGGISGLASSWWWLGAMVVAQAGFFVWALARSAEFGERFDVPLSGRYLDPFVVPIAVLGATTLWVGMRKRLANAALIAAAAAVAAYGVLVLPRAGAEWVPLDAPSLAPFLDPLAGSVRPALVLAGVVAVVGCALLWCSRERARIGIAAALTVAALVSFGTDWFRVDPFEGETRAQTLITSTLRANPGHEVRLAADLIPCATSDRIQLELAGEVVIVPSGGDYGDDLVIGPLDWPDLAEAGFAKVQFALAEGAALWTKAATD